MTGLGATVSKPLADSRTGVAGVRSALPRFRHLPMAALVLATVSLNLAYLVHDCPTELAPDEAHYWHWSQSLDWSYYSKGPLVAWLIRGSCEVFSDISIASTGSEVLAVRAPAVVCGALLLTAVYVLAFRVTRSERFALATVAAGVTVPAISATGLLITIDSPLLACWAWATVLVHRAIFRGGTWPWVAAGIVSAVGVLAKYTMLGFPGVVGLCLLACRDFRPQLRRTGFWIFVGITSLGTIPILVWNANHEWIGLRHVGALAGTAKAGKPLVDPLAVLAFLAGQGGVLLGYWFVVWAWAAVDLRPGKVRNPHVAFLWWMSVPVWLFFAVSSVRGNAEANWTAPAFVSGWVLGGVWLRSRLDSVPCRRIPAKTFERFLIFAVFLGIVGTVCARYPALVRPLIAKLCPAPTTDKPTPVRQLDPTTRLAGWRILAAEVDRLRERVRREDGEDPIIAASSWSIPGELAFYCRGNPPVYAVGLALTDRHSQYDIWRPNPIADAQAFRGRTFVYVGYRMPEMDQVFERVEPPVEVIASDGGVPVAAWEVWVCRGFRGFPTSGGRSAGAGY